MITKEEAKEALNILNFIKDDFRTVKNLHTGKPMFSTPAVFSYNYDYGKSFQIALSVLRAYTAGRLVEPKDDSLTEAYMAGFEKGKDSVKAMSKEEIWNIVNKALIKHDPDEKYISPEAIDDIASVLIGKVAKPAPSITAEWLDKVLPKLKQVRYETNSRKMGLDGKIIATNTQIKYDKEEEAYNQALADCRAALLKEEK